MIAVPESLLFERTARRVAVADRSIEIVAPDRECTDLLLEYAGTLFPAEIVEGSDWVVRLQAPSGGGWVFELLSVVERWLESAQLPCAKVVYGGRSYLIRAPGDSSQFTAAIWAAGTVSGEAPLQ
jgi:hypothetical protein